MPRDKDCAEQPDRKILMTGQAHFLLPWIRAVMGPGAARRIGRNVMHRRAKRTQEASDSRSALLPADAGGARGQTHAAGNAGMRPAVLNGGSRVLPAGRTATIGGDGGGTCQACPRVRGRRPLQLCGNLGESEESGGGRRPAELRLAAACGASPSLTSAPRFEAAGVKQNPQPRCRHRDSGGSKTGAQRSRGANAGQWRGAASHLKTGHPAGHDKMVIRAAASSSKACQSGTLAEIIPV